MATSDISAQEMLSSYNLFNATDVKSFIINQLQKGDNPLFKGIDYLGANFNGLIDVVAVMLQQILFNFSLNVSEASFSTASLYESMSKIVSILNYKSTGKQTSMVPVDMVVDLSKWSDEMQDTQIIIPKFFSITHNTGYVQKYETLKVFDKFNKKFVIKSYLFEGSIVQSPIFTGVGDEFETILLIDENIKKNKKFISDNFFSVYVDIDNNGLWKEFTETKTLFLEESNANVYEKRFTEDYNYEFKFGNDINGKKIKKDSRIVIFYLVSNGETAIVDSDVIKNKVPVPYSSRLYDEIMSSMESTPDYSIYNNITINSTGPSTDISYPESVESIRTNAPKIFSSQNRLITLSDYRSFIDKNFGTYCKDVYMMTNDEYISDFLKYYYDIGLSAPQEDTRINLAQVEFMTSTNFNNVYSFILPSNNTIISGKIPNYLNTVLKQEIVSSVAPYKALTHNLVMLDPIYTALTFGSYTFDDSLFSEDQQKNKLVLVRNRLTKYAHSFIKKSCIDFIKDYFSSLKLGSEVDVAYITKQLITLPGVKRFYIEDSEGYKTEKLTFYAWNPLYCDETAFITQQAIGTKPFEYPFFYNIDNIADIITTVDE